MRTFSNLFYLMILIFVSQAFGYGYDGNDPRSNGNGDWASSAYSDRNPRSSTDQAFNNADSWTSERKERYYKETVRRNISKTYTRSGEGYTRDGNYYDYTETLPESLFRDLYAKKKYEPPVWDFKYVIPPEVKDEDLDGWIINGNFPQGPDVAPPRSSYNYKDLLTNDQIESVNGKIEQLRENKGMSTFTVPQQLWIQISIMQTKRADITALGSAADLRLVNFDDFKGIDKEEYPLESKFISLLEKTAPKRPVVIQPLRSFGNTKAWSARFGKSIWGPTFPEHLGFPPSFLEGRRELANGYEFPVETYSEPDLDAPTALEQGFHASLTYLDGEVLRDTVTAREFRLEMGTTVSDAMLDGAQKAGLALDVVESYVPETLVDAIVAVEQRNIPDEDKADYLSNGQTLMASVFSGHAISDLVSKGILSRLSPETKEDFSEAAENLTQIIRDATTVRVDGFDQNTLSDPEIQDILDEVVQNKELLNALTVLEGYVR